MTASEEALRVELVRFARQMITSGLVRGTSGNISARQPGANWCLITPSGVEYETLEPEQLVAVRLDGERPPDQLTPSVDTPKIPGATISIFRRFLNAIDHDNFNRALRRFQFQSELLLDGCEDGRSG